MTKNYVIAVGGVGARILESIVRLCEVGYIDNDELHVIMVDNDEMNGNARKTMNLIDEYNKVRDLLGADTGTRRIFKTDLRPPGAAGNFHATPIKIFEDERKVTIYGEFSRINDRPSHNSVKALFSEREYEQDLREGFYGEVPTGRLFFTRAVKTVDDTDKNSIGALIAQIQSEVKGINAIDVKVFIAGSTFGGNGASGILPICDMLVRGLADSSTGLANTAERERLKICGYLMLPYFSFQDAEGEVTNAHISQENFLKKAMETLVPYRTLLTGPGNHDRIFDALYMSGEPSQMLRGREAYYGTDQNNLPHFLELFAAANAKNFFGNGFTPDTNNIARIDPRHITDGDSIKELRWLDYESDAGGLQKTIENFILFNYVFSTVIMPGIFDSAMEEVALDHEKLGSKGDKSWQHGMTFWEEVKGGLFEGLFRKRYRFHWYALPKEHYRLLFTYLTESAKYYSQVIHDLGGDQLQLPRLFGDSGAAMLKERALMNFKDPIRGFNFESIATNALSQPRTGILIGAAMDKAGVTGKDAIDARKADMVRGEEIFGALVRTIHTQVARTQPKNK